MSVQRNWLDHILVFVVVQEIATISRHRCHLIQIASSSSSVKQMVLLKATINSSERL
jgi:hypothetical protein